jgi:hypothetical protein
MASADTANYEPIPAQETPVTEVATPASVMLDDKQLKTFNNSDQGKKVIAYVKNEYSRALNDRRQYERQWAINLAFYAGRQYVEWSNNDNKLISQPVVSQWVPRLVVNKIQPIVRTEQSKLTGQKPSASVMPASNDDKDVFAAQAAEQVWESLYARLNFQGKLARASFWLSITGNAFIKVYWDASMYDETSKLYGDINWRPLSPYEVLVSDITEQELEAQAWVMDVQTRPANWVTSTYGHMFPKGVKPSTSRSDEVMSAVGLSLGNKTDKPDSVLIQEMWIKPGMCPDLPEGGMITLIDDVIVEAAIHGIPYEHKQFPFAKFEHIPTGRFYCTSTIEPLIPLQREYNRTKSQIVEAKNRTSKPQVLYRDGTVDPNKITTQPGLWIPVKGSGEFPQALPVQDLPSYVTQFNEQQKADFEDISGQHASTRGEAPSGMAATAISYLQEQDDSYLSLTFQSIEQGIEKIAQQSLTLAATYWTVPRLIKATGEDGGLDAILLRGSQISSATDIRIEHGSALPTSRSAKQAQVTEWMKFGWLDPNEGFELLDMPMLQQWTQQRKVDKKAAQYENIMFRDLDEDQVIEFQQEQVGNAQADLQQRFAEQQQKIATDPIQAAREQVGDGGVDPSTGNATPASIDPLGFETNPTPKPDQQGTLQVDNPAATPCIIPVNDWDDHAIHIQIHNLWRKSPSYRFVSDPIKQEVQKHVALHQAALALQMAPQMAPGTAPEGAAGPSASVRGPHGGGVSLDAGTQPSETSPFQGSNEEQLNAPM